MGGDFFQNLPRPDLGFPSRTRNTFAPEKKTSIRASRQMKREEGKLNEIKG
jgi:hypothetical protein